MRAREKPNPKNGTKKTADDDDDGNNLIVGTILH